MNAGISSIAPTPSAAPSPQVALQQLGQRLAQLLHKDPRRVLLGEDVADGGMLGLSRACSEDAALADRLLPTPLTASGTVIHACGLARAGLRPIVILPSATALIDASTALRSVVRESRSANANPCPVLFIAPFGPGFGLSVDAEAEAASAPEALLSQIAGLRILSAGRAEHFGEQLRQATDFESDPRPRVLLISRSESLSTANVDAEEGAPQATQCLNAGQDATLFCWGPAIGPARQAVEAIEAEVGMYEINTLAPLDEISIVEAAKQSGKIVIAHAGSDKSGVGAQLAALLADQAIWSLDAPVLEVTGQAPSHDWDEHNALPDSAAIADALRSVLAP